MQKAVIYPRYSSGAQKDVSIDQQVRACREFAERQGLEVVGIYEDRALTGTSDKRPGFQRMIADSAKGEWDYVIVYSLDRFARDRYDSAVYKRKLKDNGVRVLSAMENLTDDPTGILLESVLEGLAEYYSKELAQKTQRGMIDNAEKCMVNGPIPAGFEKASDGRYAIYEPEAVVIREIFHRVNDGDSVSEIIADLDAREIRTRKGTPWTRNIIYRALSNERYAGVYKYGDIRIENGIPAIVNRDLFDSVQLILENKPNPRRQLNSPKRRRNANGLYLLTGKIYCGECGSAMVGVSGKSKTGSVYYYYTCKKQKAHECNKAPLRRDQIEYEIANAIKTKVLNDETIRAIADAAIAHQKKSDGHLELEGLKNQLAETRRSLKNIMTAIENGVFTGTIQKRLLDLEEEEKRLSARVSILDTQLAHLPTRDDVIALLSIYQDGNAEDKNYQQMLLDTFLRAVYVYDDHFDLVISLGDKSKTETIPFAPELSKTLSDGLKSSYSCLDGSPIDTIRTTHATIIVYNDLFAMRIACVGEKIHT